MIITQLEGARVLDADAALSYREMQKRLSRVASHGIASSTAHAVSYRYRIALNENDQSMRESRFREFIAALNTFLVVESPPPCADTSILRSIVDENADLLREAALV